MLNNILAAISQRLDDVFCMEIYIDQLPQGFEEPCFFILTLRSNQKQIVGDRYYREHSFDVHYFPKSQHCPAREINEIADRLFMALEYVPLPDGLARGTDMRREVQDGVLHFFVNYNVFVLKQNDPIPRMRTLRQVQKLKG